MLISFMWGIPGLGSIIKTRDVFIIKCFSLAYVDLMLNHSYVIIHSLAFKKTIEAWALFLSCYATRQQTVNKQTNKDTSPLISVIHAFVLFMKGVVMYEGYCKLLFTEKTTWIETNVA